MSNLIKPLAAKLCREEDGQIAVVMVMVLPVVFLFFALALDAGLWFFDHRLAQNQADSAALAAVTGIFLLANRVIKLRFGIPFLVTVGCGGSSLFIMLSEDFPTPVDPWPYVVVGALVGYWMRNKP